MIRVVKKAEVRRAEIIQAARELIQTQGYEKTTTQDVMERLDIAKGTIYHHFESREALFEAVIESVADERIAIMQALLDGTSGNALQKLRQMIQTGNIAPEHDDLLEGLHHSENSGMHTRQLAVGLMKLAPLYASVIQQGCDEGIFGTQHPLECAEFILSATQFLTDMGVHPWQPQDLMRRMMAFPQMIEALLKAPAGSFNFLIEDERQ